MTVSSDNLDNETMNISSNQTSGYRMSTCDRKPVNEINDPVVICTIVLGTIAILLNVSTFFAIKALRKRIRSQHRFIVSLAASDVLFGVSFIVFRLHQAWSPRCDPGFGPPSARFHYCRYAAIRALMGTANLACLLSIAALAIDHFLAVTRPLHHQHTMRPSRCNLVILCLWLVAIAAGFSDFLTGFSWDEWYPIPLTFCEKAVMTIYSEDMLVFGFLIVVIGIMVATYVKIYHKVKTRYNDIPGNLLNQSSVRGNRKPCPTRSKTTLITVILILSAFMFSWLPVCLFEIILSVITVANPQLMISRPSLPSILYAVHQHLTNLLLANSIIDPLIYVMRVDDIRSSYDRLIRWMQCRGGQEADERTLGRGTNGSSFTLSRGNNTSLKVTQVSAKVCLERKSSNNSNGPQEELLKPTKAIPEVSRISEEDLDEKI